MLLKNIILDLVYPKRCPFCKEIRPYQSLQVCNKCLAKLELVKAPHCMKCGKTVREEEEYCKDCKEQLKHFDYGFPVFYYKEPLKGALYDFKYKNQRYYADFFAESMVKYYGREIKLLGIDGIVPVPVHRNKKRKRGYNQAEVLANALGNKLKIKVYPNYLIRTIDTSPQKELTEKERIKNLKNAFKIGKNDIKLKKVLLVDDIYTSGATIEACTKVLRLEDVDKIYYTSVAIGRGYIE